MDLGAGLHMYVTLKRSPKRPVARSDLWSDLEYFPIYATILPPLLLNTGRSQLPAGTMIIIIITEYTVYLTQYRIFGAVPVPRYRTSGLEPYLIYCTNGTCVGLI